MCTCRPLRANGSTSAKGGVKGGVEEHWLYAAAHLYRKRLKHDREFRGVCRIKTFMRHLALWQAGGVSLKIGRGKEGEREGRGEVVTEE